MEISQRAVKELIKHFTGQAQTLTIQRPLIKMTGDHACALMLNQILYWSERTDDTEGWFYKTHEEWAEELELTPSQIRRITKALTHVGVESKVKKHNGAPKLHYRINREVFGDTLICFLESEATKPKIRKVDNQQSPQSGLSDPITYIPDNQETSLSESEHCELSDSEESSLSSFKDAEITAETTSKPLPTAETRAKGSALRPHKESPISKLQPKDRNILEVWKTTTKGYPLESTWATILARLRDGFDPERLRRCGGAYLAYNGKGQKHVGGILDWYEEDLTEPRNERDGHAKPYQTGKLPVTRDFSKYPART